MFDCNFGYALVKLTDGCFAEVGIANGPNDDECIVNVLPRMIEPKLIKSNLKGFPAPATDSPSNILNSLNDECIAKILSYVPLEDFDSIVEVCKKFKEIGTKISIDRLSNSEIFVCDLLSDDRSKCLMRCENFLRHFGNETKSIFIRFNSYANFSNHQFGADFYKFAALTIVLTYCPQLNELKINGVSIPSEWHHTLSPFFERLEHLYLHGMNIGNLLKSCTKLISLHLDHIDDLTITAFTGLDCENLQKLTICCHMNAVELLNNVTKKRSVKFLDVVGQGADVIDLIDIVSLRFPNLEEFKPWAFRVTNLCNNNKSVRLRHQKQLTQSFARFKHLKQFAIKTDCVDYIRYLSDALINGKVPLEGLLIERSRIEDNSIESILKLKQIKKLELIGTSLQKVHLMRLLNELPCLTKLIIRDDQWLGTVIKETIKCIPPNWNVNSYTLNKNIFFKFQKMIRTKQNTNLK